MEYRIEAGCWTRFTFSCCSISVSVSGKLLTKPANCRQRTLHVRSETLPTKADYELPRPSASLRPASGYSLGSSAPQNEAAPWFRPSFRLSQKERRQVMCHRPTDYKIPVWQRLGRWLFLASAILIGSALFLRRNLGNGDFEKSWLYWLQPSGMALMIVAGMIVLSTSNRSFSDPKSVSESDTPLKKEKITNS